MRKPFRLAAVVGALLLVTLAGCTSGAPARDASGKVTAAASANSDSLRVGDCIASMSNLGTEVAKLPVLPCSEPHEAEIYAEKSLADAKAAPSEDDAKQFCVPEFETFIGRPYDAESTLQITYMYPSQASWEHGDRKIQCIVYDKNGGITGTLKGANR